MSANLIIIRKPKLEKVLQDLIIMHRKVSTIIKEYIKKLKKKNCYDLTWKMCKVRNQRAVNWGSMKMHNSSHSLNEEE